MHLHLIGPDTSTSVRRLVAAFGAARTRGGFGFFRAVLDEYRRATAAARRYEDLSVHACARAEAGVARTDVARKVFEDYYT